MTMREQTHQTASSKPDFIPVTDSDCCAASRQGGETVRSAQSISPRPVVADGPGVAGDEMVLLPGGQFLMGTDDREGYPADGEGPVRKVRLSPFWIDRAAV